MEANGEGGEAATTTTTTTTATTTATTEKDKDKDKDETWDGYHATNVKVRKEFMVPAWVTAPRFPDEPPRTMAAAPAPAPGAATADDGETADDGAGADGEGDDAAAAAAAAAAAPAEQKSFSTQMTKKGWRKRAKMMHAGASNARPQRDKDQPHFCFAFLREGSCSYGSSCTYSHDTEAFMKARQPDLGTRCLNVDRLGYCRSGLTCRYLSGHPPGGAPTAPPAVATAAAETTTATTTQQEQQDPRTLLARKKYQFLGTHKREGYVETDPKQLRRPFSLEGKVYVAPLTTVGNLPFRRVLKKLGADVTCGEMAMAYQLLRGTPSEWALLKRHPSEDLFGVQLAGSKPEELAQAAEVVSRETDATFIDINMGCPIDAVTDHGCGSALMRRPPRIEQIVEAVTKAAPCVPLGLKMRTGWEQHARAAHDIISRLKPHAHNLLYVTVHGRSRQQRYRHTANWSYIGDECAKAAHEAGIPLLGNGDVMHWADYQRALLPVSEGGHLASSETTPLAGALIGRAALIKPWICTEVKEKRVWDISASERFDLLRDFCAFGLEHWGSDGRGVETTRRYALEWLSFSHRYVPVGLLETGYAQHMNDRPPPYVGRSDLETLLASPHTSEWERLVAMVLGPAPAGFTFVPKHRANAW